MTVVIRGAGFEGAARLPQGAFAHAEGRETQAVGAASHAEGLGTYAGAGGAHAEGQGSSASASNSHAEGLNTSTTASYAHAEGGSSVASGTYSHAQGQWGRATVAASHVQGFMSASSSLLGQAGIYGLNTNTTSTSTTVLTANGSVLYNTANVLVVGTFVNMAFDVMITGRKYGTATASAAWRYSGLIARDSLSVRLVGTPTLLGSWADSTIGTVAISADTTNQCLQIAVTPNSPTQTQWQAVVYTNEMSLAA